MVLGGCQGPPALIVADDFERGVFDDSIWKLDRADGRAWIDDQREIDQEKERRTSLNGGERTAAGATMPIVDGQRNRNGRHWAAVRTFPWDVDVDEDGRNVVKREVWLAPQQRISGAFKSWYGFSLRVDFDQPDGNRTRFVAAQWKEVAGRRPSKDGAENDPTPFNSPLVAVRFDDNQLHVTVQHNGCRTTVAGTAAAVASLRLEDGVDSVGKHCDSGLHPTGAQEGKRTAPGILSNAHGRWVDLAIGFRRGGLEAGQTPGEIEIWQDGRRVVHVEGPIGNRELEELTYFKFGVYRDFDPSECAVAVERVRCRSVETRLDNFRRGPTMQSVAPWCIGAEACKTPMRIDLQRLFGISSSND